VGGCHALGVRASSDTLRPTLTKNPVITPIQLKDGIVIIVKTFIGVFYFQPKTYCLFADELKKVKAEGIKMSRQELKGEEFFFLSSFFWDVTP
jgi:hypothetical protein